MQIKSLGLKKPYSIYHLNDSNNHVKRWKAISKETRSSTSSRPTKFSTFESEVDDHILDPNVNVINADNIPIESSTNVVTSDFTRSPTIQLDEVNK